MVQIFHALFAGIRVLSVGEYLPRGTFCNIYSTHHNVVNFIHNDKVISVANRSLDCGPFRIILNLSNVKAINNLEHHSNTISLNKRYTIEYGIREKHSSILPEVHCDTDCIRNQLYLLNKSFLAQLHVHGIGFLLEENSSIPPSSSLYQRELYLEIQTGYNSLLRGQYQTAVTQLKGRGYGLTPSGDDFLIGLLLGLVFRSHIEKSDYTDQIRCIYKYSRGNNPLVNTALYQSFHGLYNSEWKEFLGGLLLNANNLNTLMYNILSRGETSGSDTLTGFFVAWKLKL